MREHGWTFEPAPRRHRRPRSTAAATLHEVYTRADAALYRPRHRAGPLGQAARTIVNNEFRRDHPHAELGLRRARRRRRATTIPRPLRAEIDARQRRASTTPSTTASTRPASPPPRRPTRRPSRRCSRRSTGSRSGCRRQRYLVGDRLTEADWRLFTTLVRFDAVYHGHFKCNLRRLADYPNLWAYTRELYQVPGVRGDGRTSTTSSATITAATRRINPTGIVPMGPLLDLDAPVDRRRNAPHSTTSSWSRLARP